MKMFGDVPEGVTVWKDESWQAPDRGFLSDQDRKFMEFCAHRTPAPSLNGITREEIKANLSKQELSFQEWYDNREVPIVDGLTLTREEARKHNANFS